jgi:gpW
MIHSGMATLTTAQKLVQAEDAYHRLMVGGQPLVVVDQNGERVEYTRANSLQLSAYIAQLRRELASPGSTTSLPVSFGPMGVWF